MKAEDISSENEIGINNVNFDKSVLDEHINSTGVTKSDIVGESFSTELLNGLQMKLESLKLWSTKAYKCTKQVVEERFGTAYPTRDPEMESKIIDVREMQQHMQQILCNARRMSTNITALAEIQKNLYNDLCLAGQRQLDLWNEFACTAETQRVISRNAINLAADVDAFCDGVNTFCNRTIVDFFDTLQGFEQARIVYDSYRREMQRRCLSNTPFPNSHLPALDTANERLRQDFLSSQEIYYQLKSVVGVKLKLLDENRVRVLQKHLYLLNNSVSSFFSGNAKDLAASQGGDFCVTPTFTRAKSSWLEEVCPSADFTRADDEAPCLSSMESNESSSQGADKNAPLY